MTTTLLRPSLRYDPDTGLAEYRKKDGWHPLTAKDGSGYIHASTGTINGKQIKRGLHRIVYAHFHGPVQEGLQVDHIDCDKLNNRLANLRAVTRTVNCRNRTMEIGASGFPGVWWGESRQLWTASVSRAGQGKRAIKVRGKDPARVYAQYYERKGAAHGVDSLRHLPKPSLARQETPATVPA